MALPERYANFGTSTLSGDITSGAIVLAVASPSTFPGSGQFRLKIENELILVNTVSGNIFDSLQRGIEGTTAAAHSSGVAVYHVATAGSLRGIAAAFTESGSWINKPATGIVGQMFFPDNQPIVWRDDGNRWRGRALSYPAHQCPPLSDFTWVNQSTSTVVQSGGIIFLQVPAGAGDNVRGMHKPIQAHPYTYEFLVMPHFSGEDFTRAGILLRQSSDGKLITFQYDTATGPGADGPYLSVFQWNSPTSFNAGVGGGNLINSGARRWNWQGIWVFRLRDDGTNRYYEVSRDYTFWQTVASTTRTSFMTPDQVGFFVNNFGSSLLAGVTILSWNEMSGS